jgi:hypothetical protein
MFVGQGSLVKKRLPNNSLNPTALSLPSYQPLLVSFGLSLASGGGLIRALCCFVVAKLENTKETLMKKSEFREKA